MNIQELKKIYQLSYDSGIFHKLTDNYNHTENRTMDQLFEQLTTLSETEKIYKHYHLIKSDLSAAKEYVEQLDPEIIIRDRLQFPELGLLYAKENPFPENTFFSTQYLFDILLMKHPCYSPSISHTHDFFEAIYVLKGKFDHVVSRRTFQMTEGDFCLVAPGIEHNIAVFSDDIVVINLLIRRSTFEDIFFNLLRGNNILSFFFLNNMYTKNISDYILFHTGQDGKGKELILDLLLEFENRQSYYAEVMNSKLITFFTLLLRKYESCSEFPPTVRKKTIQSYEIISYIQNNYRTATLSEISDHFHFTEEYTSRLIKNVTGYTFTQLQRDIRMQRAAVLLANTQSPIMDICENIGYLNPEHFIRTFKKTYHMTPGEYRNHSYSVRKDTTRK